MRNFLTILALSGIFISCQKDSFLEETGDVSVGDSTISVDLSDEEIFDNLDLQSPRPSLDNSTKGLYRGIFSTYDGQDHGEILINFGNDDTFVAAVHFVDGQKIVFSTNDQSRNSANFRNNEGSFAFSFADTDNPIASEVIYNGKPGYIRVFKEISSRRISVALGHYEDDGDRTFKGNWDLISFGIAEFNFPGANLLDMIILSRGEQVFTDTDSNNLEEFSGCFGFDVRGAYLAKVSGDIGLLEGKNQLAVFNGLRCEWNLSYSMQNEESTYSDSSCNAEARSGTWTWNSRRGRIFVDALRIH